MKDQARKGAKSRSRKVWIVKTATGEEYEAFCKEKQSALAIARQMGIKADKIYKSNERWSKK